MNEQNAVQAEKGTINDFPIPVIEAYHKLADDLAELEKDGGKNPPLKTILNFLQTLEIREGAVRVPKSAPAAHDSAPRPNPESALWDDNMKYARRTEPTLPREAGGARLHDPSDFRIIELPSQLARLVQDLINIRQQLHYEALDLSFKISTKE